ncbi:Eco57I restriction-modification methylase domain-containing protein [Caldimonas caldifontis]|uniref:Eco57I restriction-modification methylase domain-containing protein n=1 Tax=Caldimonas caldifontis TaxID=1452508 RepID=UPI001B7FFC1A|nr:Eco57I restriction-modification methylase domain-containing protein [Caldimonas caldifontis]
MTNLDLDQLALDGFCPVSEAVEELARSERADERRGAIFTKREVVEFILDLVGYTDDKPLHTQRLLEPSFGGGDFLLPAVERLLRSWDRALKAKQPVGDLAECIRAVELHEDSWMRTRDTVIEVLLAAGIERREASRLTSAWLIQGDFLLSPIEGCFDFVVGNPPYVRQELIPNALLSVYRKRFSTLYDRADLYIPFIERSLKLLSGGGVLSFICADRWMKNRYGGPLRELVARDYHLRVYVDMVDTPAFHSDVIAYPAITVIGRETPGPTRVAERPELSASSLKTLAKSLRGESKKPSPLVRELTGVASGSEPWVLHASDTLDLVRRIESSFPTLEAAGCKVGIGVATGADKAFIGPIEELDVEPDRKLPLVMTRDIDSGRVNWQGKGVINPFTDEGRLVDLAEFPKLRAYLEARKDQIAGRHVAQKMPANWYRTIDRITPDLARREKLLIPDIKGQAQVVYEDGQLYPHHNLYFVVSDTWELKALQAILLSRLTRLFVATYSTKMRGGFLRFQAQYLRRIRLPLWDTVPLAMRKRLSEAADMLDLEECDKATCELYGLSAKELLALDQH